jgi:hypothetical protein
MLTHSEDKDGWTPGQIAGLLRLAVDEEARPQDRSLAKFRLGSARMSYDALGLAVKKVARKNRRLQAELRAFVLEIFGAE